jgi:hypothetical protein
VLNDQLAGTGVHATSITITAAIGSSAHFQARDADARIDPLRRLALISADRAIDLNQQVKAIF